jgi:hypothetical protein
MNVPGTSFIIFEGIALAISGLVFKLIFRLNHNPGKSSPRKNQSLRDDANRETLYYSPLGELLWRIGNALLPFGLGLAVMGRMLSNLATGA